MRLGWRAMNAAARVWEPDPALFAGLHPIIAKQRRHALTLERKRARPFTWHIPDPVNVRVPLETWYAWLGDSAKRVWEEFCLLRKHEPHHDRSALFAHITNEGIIRRTGLTRGRVVRAVTKLREARIVFSIGRHMKLLPHGFGKEMKMQDTDTHFRQVEGHIVGDTIIVSEFTAACVTAKSNWGGARQHKTLHLQTDCRVQSTDARAKRQNCKSPDSFFIFQDVASRSDLKRPQDKNEKIERSSSGPRRCVGTARSAVPASLRVVQSNSTTHTDQHADQCARARVNKVEPISRETGGIDTMLRSTASPSPLRIVTPLTRFARSFFSAGGKTPLHPPFEHSEICFKKSNADKQASCIMSNVFDQSNPLETNFGSAIGNTVRNHDPNFTSEAMPSIQCIATMALCKIPAPPLLDSKDTRARHAFLLSQWYLGAVSARLSSKPLRNWKHITKSKHFSRLVKAAAKFIEHQVAPASWCAWSCEVWRLYINSRTVPTMAWVFDVKRIEKQHGWFHADGEEVLAGMHVYTPSARELLDRRARMFAHIAFHVNPSSELLERIRDYHFPNNLYDELSKRAVVEAREYKHDLQLQVSAGKWVWG